MRVAIVGHHAPGPRASAAGRIIYANALGLIDAGHDVRVWAWQPHPPAEELPEWCHWSPVPPASALRVRARALVAPRTDIVRADWPFEMDDWFDGATAIAEDATSWAATRHFRRRAATLHYLTALDEAAIGSRGRQGVQDRRAERRTVREAHVVLAYSDRVAKEIRGIRVPAGYVAPLDGPAGRDDPVAVVAADWRWRPNQWALERLLRAWTLVRDAVPAARLRLVGVGLDSVGTIAGVEPIGPVSDTAGLFAEATVMPFPYPGTSGPKVKVMEALASGVAVVTTPAGIEGVETAGAAGAVITDASASTDDFAARLVEVLIDPQRADALGAAGRAAMIEHHSPEAAATAIVDALTR